MGEIKFSGSVSLEEPSSLGYFLWKHGHLHNPDHPTGIDPLEPDEALSLKRNSEAMEAGVMSYMEWFEQDLDEFVQHHHGGRHLAMDGHAGPAFVELANEPRCGYPDYMAAGKQEANWPDSCRRDLIFGRSFRDIRGLDEAGVDKAFIGACRAISRALSDANIKSQGHGPRGSARIYADAKRLSGSTLAWSYLARSRCNDVLAQAYGTGTNWSVGYLCTVAVHEIGHALGGPHVKHRDATMYPSIHQRSLGRFGYYHSADLSMFRGLGYKASGLGQPDEDYLFGDGEPDEPDQPDEPETPSGELVIEGVLRAILGGEDIGEYIVSKKPKV